MKNAMQFTMPSVFRSGLLAVLLLMFSHLDAQLFISNFEKFGLGIGTRSAQPFILEARIGTNNRLVDTRIELAGLYQLQDETYHSISAGIAIALSPFADVTNIGLTIPVQLEIFPIPDFKRIALFIEAGPEFLLDQDEVDLRHTWGFRYYFSEPY
ncbi:MAG TPA: hypothetical protein VFG10_03195 [Saprospiraceae bacterium]|nr:hypothetical protein [Saprospiraceae bacterium]